jgi:hypothetical protein
MTNSETSSGFSTEQLYRPQSRLDLLGLRAAIENDTVIRGIEADRGVYEQKNGGLRLFVEDAWRYVDPSPFIPGWHIEQPEGLSCASAEDRNGRRS